MSSTTINLADLDAEQVAAIIAQVNERNLAAAAKVKADRAHGKAVVQDFVERVTSTLAEQTFQSGARGHSLGGKFTSEGRTFRVSVLIRDEATIPAKDQE